MKVLITGDWHLTDNRPEKRTDDYEKTVFRKLDFLLQKAVQEKVEIILHPGDVFDSPKPSYAFFTKVMKRIKRIHPIWFACCYGQHDLRYRNKDDTALKALALACSGNIVLDLNDHWDSKISIYSAGYGESIPDLTIGWFNILLTHRMIVYDKLWKSQDAFEYCNTFLRKNKFDLIVSGDNHNSFSYTLGNRNLFNCGSMMRSTIAQVHHRPIFYIMDTSKEMVSLEQYYIPIEPAEEVFIMNKIEQEKDRNTKLEAFVSGLSEHKEMGMSFGDNIENYMNENKIESGIRQIIMEGMK